MPETRVTVALIAFAVVAAIVGFMTASEPRSSTVLHVLSMGIVVSAIFYFVVVWVPARQRKARIHRNLKKYYDAFRLSCISTFLIASDSKEYRPVEWLLDQEEFRRHFSFYVADHQTRWDAVLNALNQKAFLLRDILHDLEILREEFLHVLSSIDVHDEEVFEFLKRLAHAIFRLRDVKPEYDDIKFIGGFLWEIFAGWSLIEGYKNEDIVLSMIERI